MTSARRTGTNEVVSSYGSVGMGRDYTAMAVWETATQVDLVTLTLSQVLECYDDAVFNDSVTIAGATTNVSYFRMIRPAGVRGEASWQGHDGTPNTGVRFSTNTNVVNISISESYTQVQDIVATQTTNTPGTYIVFYSGGAESAFVGCIAHDATNMGTGGARSFTTNGVSTKYITDCLAVNAKSQGFQVESGTLVLSNSTAVENLDVGFKRTGGTLITRNCLADGNVVADYSGTFDAASTNNASSDATAPGTNARPSQTFTFVDAASDDYHLDPTDTGAHGFGADLSADATFPFDDDIDGETITTWSIGADAQAAEAPAPTQSGGAFVALRRRRR